MSPKARRFLTGVTMWFCWHQWVRLAVAVLLALSGVAAVGAGWYFSPIRPRRRRPCFRVWGGNGTRIDGLMLDAGNPGVSMIRPGLTRPGRRPVTHQGTHGS
jgi:hypothetical protein